MKAIETRYKGYRFRSRLEARWAVFFDALRLKWQYEPEGFELPGVGRYLPDFWIPADPQSRGAKEWPGAGYWLEVKGVRPSDDELRKLKELATATGHHAYLVVGDPVDGTYFYASAFDSDPPREGWPGMNAQVLGSLFSSAPVDFYAVALTARSARFEFGESGVR